MSPDYATPECAPFFRISDGDECCLCLHGFTGCPALYLPLAERLFALGYSASAPLLPGHGTRPEDLMGVPEASWYEHAAASLEYLLARYKTVHLIGLSLGGALAARLAAAYGSNPGIGKLALLSPGLGIRDKKFYAIDYETVPDRLIPLPQRQPKGDGLDASRYGYPAMPLSGVGQLIRAADKANAALERIRARTLLLYTAADAIADPEACDKAVPRIASLESWHRYEGGEHNLLLGPDRLDVMERLERFLTGEGGA